MEQLKESVISSLITKPEELKRFLLSTPSADLAELVSNESTEEQILIFNTLPQEKATELFSYLPFKVQKKLLNLFPSHRVATLLNALPPDDRTTLLEELPNDIVTQLLKYLSPEEKALSVKLLGYPENSVGRLMTPDYIAIKMDWTVKQVLDYIREKGRDTETLNVVYAVDDKGRLVDDFRIRQFLVASLDTKVRDLSDLKYTALDVHTDLETAIQIFRKYDRTVLPVIDGTSRQLLGIVTIDDMIDVAVDEDTEDIHRAGGIVALDEPYMDTPFFSLIRKRIVWLTVLFVGEMLTASALGYYENEIRNAVVLALFLPLIVSSGGNAGSQASTLIIRALALGEVTLRDWARIMRREILSGLVLGFALGVIGFFRVNIWGSLFNMYGIHHMLIALTVGLALVGVILWGTLMGSMLPLVLKKFGFDPAVSSAPFVATLVDVTGLVIYFTIASVVLQGSLL